MQIRVLHTLDLLFIPEPAQVSGGLAALGDASQSDAVSLLGRLCQAIDLWPLWYTCWTEWKSQRWTYFTHSSMSLCNNKIIRPFWEFPCNEIRAHSTLQHPWAVSCSRTHGGGILLTQQWMVSLATGPSPPLRVASYQLQKIRTSSGV